MLGAQQLAQDRVLDQRPGDVPLREPGGDRAPGASAVVAAEDVRTEVAPLVVVEERVHTVGIVPRRDDIAHVDELRNAGEGVEATPGGPSVLGRLQESVVGPDPEHVGIER